jgi:hypothetical protein
VHHAPGLLQAFHQTGLFFRKGTEDGCSHGKDKKERPWWPLGIVGAKNARRPAIGSLLVAQLAAQDLAHRGLGQLGAELDHLGLLVAGQVGRQ